MANSVEPNYEQQSHLDLQFAKLSGLCRNGKVKALSEIIAEDILTFLLFFSENKT